MVVRQRKKDLKTSALDLLANREHSRLELKRKLLQRGFAEAEIEELLLGLAQKRLQSDQRFVESYLAMRVRRGFGPLKVAAELHHRGISPSEITNALRQYESQWQTVITAHYAKKFGQAPLQDRLDLAKRFRYLVSKGFTTEQIKWVLKYEDD